MIGKNRKCKHGKKSQYLYGRKSGSQYGKKYGCRHMDMDGIKSPSTKLNYKNVLE